MLLRIFEYIPILQNLVSFPFSAHKKALKKFAFLWVISIFPIFLAFALIPIPSGGQVTASFLVEHLKKAVNASELFVYAVAFISPLLFMVYEKYNDSDSDNIKSKLSESAVFPGYWLTATLALLVMLVTAVGFAMFKSQSGSLSGNVLALFLINGAPAIYVSSLFCWYLTLLDGAFVGDYVQRGRDAEDGLLNSFRERVGKS